MEKFRVYELAKELNTTSKRLMEKLAEINVEVKNHMSLLSDDELKALYKHIGVIKHDETKKAEVDDKKPIQTSHVPNTDVNKDIGKEIRKEAGKDIKKDIKSAPRIIRKTEIIIDTKTETNAPNNSGYYDSSKNNYGDDVRGNNLNTQKRDFVRKADNNSGLRAGYIRDEKPAYKKEQRPVEKIENVKEDVKVMVNDADQSKNITAEQKINVDEKDKTLVNANEPKLNQLKQHTEQPAEAAAKTTSETADPVVKQPEESKQRPITNNEVKKNTYSRDTSGGNNQRPYNGQNRTYNSNQGNRPYNGQNQRPYNNSNDRPGASTQGTGNRPYNNSGNRPYGNPSGGSYAGHNNRPNMGQNDRPAGQYNRPNTGSNNSGYNRGPYDRPRTGNADNRQGQRPGGDRPINRSASKPLEIPKIELTAVQKEEASSVRSEERRSFQSRDFEKDTKREQKREQSKGQTVNKDRKVNPSSSILGLKKGVSEVLSEDFILNEFYSDNEVKKNKRGNRPRKDVIKNAPVKYIPPRAVLTNIKIHEPITVKDLAEALKKTSTEVIKKLMALGMMVTLNNELDFETAEIIASEFGVKAEKEQVINEEDILFDDSDEDEEGLETRPPVVVVMGHVDHGKTSLLDAVKETNVIESEAGGITQHIGASTVKINSRNITFLDTPGHEAFTAMRARGAQATDIAILVVAADDGVMPQTIEAINHAKAAKITIIVAINKIDKPGADPEKVKQELTEYGLVAEEWGGDTIFVPVSAKKRLNIDQLLEMVILAADMLELKANPNKQAKGTVIEAKLDKGRGPIATVLVQRGTLNTGDSIVTGTTVGRIRAMIDDKGHKLKKAGPSTPVEILGLPDVPEAGELFYAITDEKIAKQLAEKRKTKHREEHLKASAKISLDDLYSQIKEGKVKDLNLIVKADVQGSVEAVKQSLDKLSNDEVRVNIIHGAVGAITESDVTLAQVSNAIIIGFNVRPGANVADAAQNAGVDLRLYRVIYNAIEDIKSAMNGMLEPTFKEVIQGHTEIRQIFKVSGIGTIGGCYVTDGKIIRNSDVRVVRGGIVVFEGKLASLKRFKDDVKEAAQGYECGLSIEKFNDIKEGDVVESFVMEEVER